MQSGMQAAARDAARTGAAPARSRDGLEAGPAALPDEEVAAAVRAALAEDIGPGDLTSEHAVPADARARARLVAKAHGRIAGLAFFARAFRELDPDARVELRVRDGDAVAPRDLLATVEGDARALLGAERTALNFLQHLSGIATHTARFVERVAGRARVLDTRKTTPGWRRFEKYAVRCGGGENHRIGLYDEVMVKENHAALGSKPLPELVAELRRAVGASVRMTVEARDRDEALAAVAGGADIVLLDNMSAQQMSEICPELRRAAGERAVQIEASGGIELATVDAVADSGVDRISLGCLTHSAPALDLSLYLEPLP